MLFFFARTKWHSCLCVLEVRRFASDEELGHQVRAVIVRRGIEDVARQANQPSCESKRGIGAFSMHYLWSESDILRRNSHSRAHEHDGPEQQPHSSRAAFLDIAIRVTLPCHTHLPPDPRFTPRHLWHLDTNITVPNFAQGCPANSIHTPLSHATSRPCCIIRHARDDFASSIDATIRGLMYVLY